MTEEEAKELAEQHWKFLERWLHMIYVDALVHGVKHGVRSVRPAKPLHFCQGVFEKIYENW